MSLSVPLEPPSKEILHISAHYLVILVKYIYSIQFNSIYIYIYIYKEKKNGWMQLINAIQFGSSSKGKMTSDDLQPYKKNY